MTRPEISSWPARWIWNHPAPALAVGDTLGLRALLLRWQRRMVLGNAVACPALVAIPVVAANTLLSSAFVLGLVMALAAGLLSPAIRTRATRLVGMVCIQSSSDFQVRMAWEGKDDSSSPPWAPILAHKSRLWCYEIIHLVLDPEGRKALELRHRELLARRLNKALPPAGPVSRAPRM